MSQFLPCHFFKSWDWIPRLKLPPLTSSVKKVGIGEYSCLCTAPTVLISLKATAPLAWSKGTAQNEKHHTPFPSQYSKPGDLYCIQDLLEAQNNGKSNMSTSEQSNKHYISCSWCRFLSTFYGFSNLRRNQTLMAWSLGLSAVIGLAFQTIFFLYINIYTHIIPG